MTRPTEDSIRPATNGERSPGALRCGHSPLIVAAHGFRSTGPSTPTQAHVGDFLAWMDQCRMRLGGISEPDRLIHESAILSFRGELEPAPIAPPVLTFDDALASVVQVADHVPAAILFVVVEHVGQRNDWPGQPGWVPRERCLDWPAIRSLAERGWRIGAHSMTHPRLSRLAPAAQRYEIEASRKSVEDKLGLPCPYFAYPYGDAPASARRVVANLGLIGFGMAPGRPGPHCDPACMPRVDLFDLVRPGLAAQWAWSGPGFGEVFALRCKRSIGRLLPRRGAA